MQVLKIQFNKLYTLPPEIGDLENLRELYLEFNNLTHLPPEIGKLSNLRILEIGRNNLIKIPPEIGNLTGLTELNVARSGGDLRLPGTFCSLKKLDNLYVDETQLVPPCLSVMRRPNFRIVRSRY